MRTFGILCLLGLLAACASGPQKTSKELTCMEKTTRKECSPNKVGEMVCACVPDESEMYSFYPN